MNPRQHPISTHLERWISALLPGGTWQVSRLVAAFCPAEPVAIRATKHQAMPYRGFNRDCRKA